MTLVVRFVLGAALLLTGASAAMAASDTPPAANQSLQTSASTATAASNNAPVAYQSVQTGTSAAIAASNNAPIADQSQKSHHSSFSDNNDPYGGNDPNSTAGIRAFFVPQY
jgi:hypothetical protein